jgi:hypothetical protein
MRKHNGRSAVLLTAMLFVFFSVVGIASAKFISEEEAKTVVQNWLEITPIESLSITGTEVREVMRFEGGQYGNPGYYIVLLEPEGWVIVPADDNYEAVIAFGQGSFSREEYVKSSLASLIQVNAEYERDERNDVQSFHNAFSVMAENRSLTVH